MAWLSPTYLDNIINMEGTTDKELGEGWGYLGRCTVYKLQMARYRNLGRYVS